MVNKWYIIGKISSSSYRIKILSELNKGYRTPSELESLLEIKISHISRALKELTDIGLVRCLNPELRKNKIYSLTKKGKHILKELPKS